MARAPPGDISAAVRSCAGGAACVRTWRRGRHAPVWACGPTRRPADDAQAPFDLRPPQGRLLVPRVIAQHVTVQVERIAKLALRFEQRAFAAAHLDGWARVRRARGNRTRGR